MEKEPEREKAIKRIVEVAIKWREAGDRSPEMNQRLRDAVDILLEIGW